MDNTITTDRKTPTCLMC